MSYYNFEQDHTVECECIRPTAYSNQLLLSLQLQSRAIVIGSIPVREPNIAPSAMHPGPVTNGVAGGCGTESNHAHFLNDKNGVRPNGIASPRGIDVPMRDVSGWTPERKLDIITVGAGFSGLILAHKLQHQYPEFQEIVNHKIFEARDDVGGTWLVNRYPGVQCDVPAHIYVSSWRVGDSKGD